MTTIRDVAKAAGASTATVSHVLNQSRFVAPETKERVETAIRELNYHPHEVARSLRRSRTGTIGVMISDIANPFFADLVLGVEDVVHRDAGRYNFILCNTEESFDKERMYLDVLSQKRVDGLIIAPAGGNADVIRKLISDGLPVVCVDRELEGVNSDTIVVDNREAARTLTRHLVTMGRRRIAILQAQLTANSIDERVEGWRDALAEAGLEWNAAFVAVSNSNIDSACAAAYDLLAKRPRPDAIFCTNNFMTLGAVRAVAELGLSCPDDVAIAGVDDLPWTAGFRPRLTAVAQPARMMGREAASLLLDRIAKRRTDGPARVVLPTELHIREVMRRPAAPDRLIPLRRAPLPSLCRRDEPAPAGRRVSKCPPGPLSSGRGTGRQCRDRESLRRLRSRTPSARPRSPWRPRRDRNRERNVPGEFRWSLRGLPLRRARGRARGDGPKSETNAGSPELPTTRPVSRFMAGDPMNPATNRFRG